MKRVLIVGVMGGKNVPANCLADAYQLGALIAQQGWILLNGGRNAGIMAASSEGAAEHGGLTIGILPDAEPDIFVINANIFIPGISPMSLW
jgi:uncharacterized protein (TIGR00725 family)